MSVADHENDINNNDNKVIFIIKNTKLYVPVVSKPPRNGSER